MDDQNHFSVLSCGHVACTDCLRSYLKDARKKKCPICFQALKEKPKQLVLSVLDTDADNDTSRTQQLQSRLASEQQARERAERSLVEQERRNKERISELEQKSRTLNEAMTAQTAALSDLRQHLSVSENQAQQLALELSKERVEANRREMADVGRQMMEDGFKAVQGDARPQCAVDGIVNMIVGQCLSPETCPTKNILEQAAWKAAQSSIAENIRSTMTGCLLSAMREVTGLRGQQKLLQAQCNGMRSALREMRQEMSDIRRGVPPSPQCKPASPMQPIRISSSPQKTRISAQPIVLKGLGVPMKARAPCPPPDLLG